jgi:hypothetical protein
MSSGNLRDGQPLPTDAPAFSVLRPKIAND